MIDGAINFWVPLPPSINRAKRFDPRRGRPVTAKHVTEWRKQATAALLVQQVEAVTGPFVLVTNMQRPSKGSDVDNRLKLLFDLLHSRGITADDKHCRAFAASWIGEKTVHPKAYVMIAPAQHVPLEYLPHEKTSLGGWFNFEVKPQTMKVKT